MPDDTRSAPRPASLSLIWRIRWSLRLGLWWRSGGLVDLDSLVCRLLDDADFVVGQAVQVVDELVDLAVGGVDLALERSLFVSRLRRRELRVQVRTAIYSTPFKRSANSYPLRVTRNTSPL